MAQASLRLTIAKVGRSDDATGAAELVLTPQKNVLQQQRNNQRGLYERPINPKIAKPYTPKNL